MVRWDLSANEVSELQNLLQSEQTRLTSILNPAKRIKAEGKRLQIDHLLSALKKARDAAEDGFDLKCYCDTNYDFYSKPLHVAYRIGDSGTVNKTSKADMQPPPDEYLGIIDLLNAMKEQKVTGKALVITDAARCAIALQQGLRYKVSRHSVNQAPTKKELSGKIYEGALDLTKELLQNGCHVEFSYRHRGFINEALSID